MTVTRDSDTRRHLPGNGGTAASMPQSVRATFRAVAVTVVPEAAALGPGEWRELEEAVNGALVKRPVALRRQLVTFLRLIEWIPVARFGSRFSRSNPDHRARFLTALQNARPLLIRRGFWGLRTLVFMGYYTRPDVQSALGYRADPRGWGARRTSGEMQAAVTDASPDAT